RTETEVELRDGQTFAIAGLLDNKVDETLRKVPGIGDIPVLGYLFKSQAYEKKSTELVVMITPHILRRDSPGVTPNLPGLVQPFLQDPSKRMAQPPAAFTNQVSQVQPASAPAGATADKSPTPVPALQAPATPATGSAVSQNDLKAQEAQRQKEQASLAKENAARQAAQLKDAKAQKEAAGRQ